MRLTWDHFDYRGGDIDDFNDGMYQALLVSQVVQVIEEQKLLKEISKVLEYF